MSERGFSSSVDFWIATNQALNQSKEGEGHDTRGGHCSNMWEEMDFFSLQ